LEPQNPEIYPFFTILSTGHHHDQAHIYWQNALSLTALNGLGNQRRTYEAVGTWPWALGYKMRKVSGTRRPSSMKIIPVEAKAKRRSRKMVESGLTEGVAS